MQYRAPAPFEEGFADGVAAVGQAQKGLSVGVFVLSSTEGQGRYEFAT
jgi:hypothetical protein